MMFHGWLFYAFLSPLKCGGGLGGGGGGEGKGATNVSNDSAVVIRKYAISVT